MHFPDIIFVMIIVCCALLNRIMMTIKIDLCSPMFTYLTYVRWCRNRGHPCSGEKLNIVPSLICTSQFWSETLATSVGGTNAPGCKLYPAIKYKIERQGCYATGSR